MADEGTSAESSARAAWWKRGAPATLLGVLLITILVTIVSTVLYDLLVKPGLSSLGGVLLSLVTLGSGSVRDTAYAGAAIDPTSLSSLLLLFFATTVPLGLATGKLVSAKLKSVARSESKTMIQNPKFRFALRVLIGVYCFAVLGAFLVHNQSVLVWRVFHANLAIIAPHIDEQTRLQLVSEFSSIEDRADYLSIDAVLASTAAKTGVQLRDVRLW